MNNKARAIIFLSVGLFLFGADRWLKYASLNFFNEPRLWFKYFGWQPYLNSGAAFGLPAPNLFTIIITAPILIIFLFLIIQFWKQKNFNAPLNGFTFIFLGALSNLIDRVAIGRTVDYFLIFTGIINIGDGMIVIGFGLYLLKTIKKEVATK